MLLGHWKNFAELEDSLTLDELQAVVKASRDREYRQFRAMAAVQGIDLDDREEPVDKVEEIKMKLAAQASGKSQDHFEIGLLGFDAEIEE